MKQKGGTTKQVDRTTGHLEFKVAVGTELATYVSSNVFGI
jgi:hypothetical protein